MPADDFFALMQASRRRGERDTERFALVWLDDHRPQGGSAWEIARDANLWALAQGDFAVFNAWEVSDALARLDERGLVQIFQYSRGQRGTEWGVKARARIPRSALLDVVPELASIPAPSRHATKRAKA